MKYSIVIYPCLSAVPICYILYSVNRIRRHRKDGKEHRPRYTSTLLLKLMFSFLIILLLSFKIYTVRQEGLEVILFYGFYLVSWITSFFMLNFEFFFKLLMKWLGHRIFLFFSLAVWTALLIANKDLFDKKLHKNVNAEFGLIFVCGFFNFCLCVLCIWKPNEFELNNRIDDRPLIRSVKNSYDVEKSAFGKLNVKIRDYKLKNIEGKSLIVFNICVKFEDSIHFVKKSLQDFEKLASSIKEAFPQSSFPNLAIPALPRNARTSMATDELMGLLNEFLEKVAQVDFFNETTLLFLEVEGHIHDILLKEHLDLIESQDVMISDSSKTGVIDFSTISYERSQSSMFVKESSFVYVNVVVKAKLLDKSHIEYNILTFCQIGHQEIVKIYKDFITLHRILKSKIENKILPKFPKKNYFKFASKIDVQSIEIRRKKLETYLKHILNDPVYHIPEVFEFINFKGNFKDLWSIDITDTFSLDSIEWETGIDEDDAIIFIISVYSKSTKWQVKRHYKDFESIHKFLSIRNSSNNLKSFSSHLGFPLFNLPDFPRPLSSLTDNIEILRESLEAYLKAVLESPLNLQSYSVIRFLKEI